MSWWQVVVLAVVQGSTEFLPVSSSGHLAIVARIFFAGDAGASFTAVSQLGTEAAVLAYFARDIVRIRKAWCSGLFKGLTVKSHRNVDYRLGWYIIIGTIPICILGLFFKDEIRSGVRNLWVVPDAFHPVTSGMSATGPQLLVATLIAFVIGLAAVAWLLRFLVRHSMYWFVGYRVAAGGAVLTLLGNGTVTAT
jgi:undecaprenyl-diphosphatase